MKSKDDSGTGRRKVVGAFVGRPHPRAREFVSILSLVRAV